MDVAGEREGDRARHGRIPCSGAVRQEDLERARRCRPQRQIDERLLRVVGRPVVRIVDAQQGERRAVPLDHVAGVVHEYLSGVPHPAGHLGRAGIVIVVPQYGDTTERRRQVAKRAHVRGDVTGRDIDHVACLHDEVRPELPQVHAGVQIGEVQQRHPVEPRGQVGKAQGAPRDDGHPVRAPDPVAGERGAGSGVRVGRAREELPAGETDGRSVRQLEGHHTIHPPRLPSLQRPDQPQDRLHGDIEHDEPAEHPPQELPGDPGSREGNPGNPPHGAEQHAVGDEEPREVEDRERGRERGAHQVRPSRGRGVRKALPQVQIDQRLRRHEQEQID